MIAQNTSVVEVAGASKVGAGKQIRNFRLSMGDFSSQTYKHILLPLWVGIYHHKDREFHVLINGQTGKIGGRKPIDRLKVGLLVAGAAITLIFIIMLYIILANLGPQP
ncbi:MAG: hypothetical protein IIA63_04105 [Nitrospinae bacterium]|nr:hypothetical protein [Nitrospinota bacterium]